MNSTFNPKIIETEVEFLLLDGTSEIFSLSEARSIQITGGYDICKVKLVGSAIVKIPPKELNYSAGRAKSIMSYDGLEVVSFVIDADKFSDAYDLYCLICAKLGLSHKRSSEPLLYNSSSLPDESSG